MAAALAEARGRFPADRQFSHWIVDVGLEDINHQDRAALINMAADLTTARRILEETKRLSWRHIWEDEMKPWFTQVDKPDLLPPDVENPPVIPEPEANATPETMPPAAPIKAVSKKSPFHGLERADEVAAVYLHIDARGDLAKAIKARGGKEI